MIIAYLKKSSSFIMTECTQRSMSYKKLDRDILIVSPYFSSLLDDVKDNDNDILAFIATHAIGSYHLHIFIAVEDPFHYGVSFDCYILENNLQLYHDIETIGKATGLPVNSRVELEDLLSSMPESLEISNSITQDLNVSLRSLRERILSRDINKGEYSFL